MKSEQTPDVAILGAGLMGRLLAWRLSNSGISVQVYDQHPLIPDMNSAHKAAAFTAAAMLSPVSELVSGEPEIFRLGNRSITLWQHWLEQSGLSHLLHRRGSIITAHAADHSELTSFRRRIHHHLREEADHHLHALESTDAFRNLEPDFSTALKHGYFLPGEAHLDHLDLLQNILDESVNRGVLFHESSPVIIRGRDAYSHDKKIRAGCIIDCRGTGAVDRINSLRGVRGEVLRLSCPEVCFSRPIRLLHPRYKLYLVPKPGNCYVLGATEIESDDRSPVSVRSSMELTSALYTLHPGFAEARILNHDINLRPALPDNLPEVQLSPDFISVNGLYRHGYLIAPALADDIVSYITSNKKITVQTEQRSYEYSD